MKINSTMIALVFGFSQAFAQPKIFVLPADFVDAFEQRDNVTIILDPTLTYDVGSVITVSGKTGLILDGQGATVNILSGGRFNFDTCQNTVIKGLNIFDRTTESANVFEFRACANSGLERVNYFGSYYTKKFAYILNGSSSCFVRDCRIQGVYDGIFLGTRDGMLDWNTTGYTRECHIENNSIVGFKSGGIATRQSGCCLGDIYAPTNRLKHVIRGNRVFKGNAPENVCTKETGHGCIINIEIWGSDNTIENNIVEVHPTGMSYMGFSFVEAHRNIIRNNRITGRFTYQGMELQHAENNVISGNTFDGIQLSADYNSAAIGVSSDDKDTLRRELFISRGNRIVDNHFINCGRAILLGESKLKSKNTLIESNLFIGSQDAAIVGKRGADYSAYRNRFVANRICILNDGGMQEFLPIQIAGNEFTSTMETVLINANLDTPNFSVNPIIFEDNIVHGWGSQNSEPAMIIGGHSSRFQANLFKQDGRSTTWPVCVKKFSSSQVRNIFLDNVRMGPTTSSTPPPMTGVVSGTVPLDSYDFIRE